MFFCANIASKTKKSTLTLRPQVLIPSKRTCCKVIWVWASASRTTTSLYFRDAVQVARFCNKQLNITSGRQSGQVKELWQGFHTRVIHRCSPWFLITFVIEPMKGDETNVCWRLSFSLSPLFLRVWSFVIISAGAPHHTYFWFDCGSIAPWREHLPHKHKTHQLPFALSFSLGVHPRSFSFPCTGIVSSYHVWMSLHLWRQC